MTFKELSLQDELKGSASAFGLVETEQAGLKSFLENQSPVMKIWFALMVANLLLFLVFMQ